MPTSTATPAVEVRDLRKVYRDGWFFPKKFEALKGISLSVQRGEIFGLLGPNGAGKTTLLKILLGIIRKSSGSASMLGMPAGSQSVRRQVGYLPEHLRVPAHLTAYTALECYGNLSNVPNSVIRRRRDELLDLVGLGGRTRERVKKFSKGMLQRLGLAQALLHEPQMLILDEPTDGLDPRARAEMRSIIRQLKERGVTIFLNSHLLQEVEMICDRVAILNRGNLLYCGLVSDVGSHLAMPQTGIVVEFLVAGARPQIETVFAGQNANVQATPRDREFEIRVALPDQSAIDQQIDRLRQNQISLLQMQRKQVSLEDAFLALVDKET